MLKKTRKPGQKSGPFPQANERMGPHWTNKLSNWFGTIIIREWIFVPRYVYSSAGEYDDPTERSAVLATAKCLIKHAQTVFYFKQLTSRLTYKVNAIHSRT